MEIKVKETTVVRPVEKTPQRSLWLSDLDLLYRGGYSITVFFYRPNGASNFFDATILKEALGKALVPFYPIAGRFKHNENGRLEIDCNSEGVLFVEAESSSVIDDLGDFTPSPEIRKLTPTIEFSVGISSLPFILIQVTRFKCGGVSLGLGVEHCVMDGHSVFEFLNTVSEIARGLDVTIQPFLDRTVLSPRDPPRLISSHTEYQITPPAMKPNTESQSSKIVIFKVTREQLEKLKSKARKQGSTINYSTYVTLAGHIWRCTSIARKLSGDEETIVFFPVNGRSRLEPPLPPNYLGNVIFSGVSVSKAGDLQSKPLWYAASRIHESLVAQDSIYLRSVLDYLKLHPGTKRYDSDVYRSPNFAFTSWLRLPVYVDFGWGKPFYMGLGAMHIPEGRAIISPNAANDGSLSVMISLQPQPMEVFEKLFYEFDTIETKLVKNSFGRSNM